MVKEIQVGYLAWLRLGTGGLCSWRVSNTIPEQACWVKRLRER